MSNAQYENQDVLNRLDVKLFKSSPQDRFTLALEPWRARAYRADLYSHRVAQRMGCF